MLLSYNLFECMGIDYIGPVDGNDIVKTEIVLKEAKTKDVCTLVHLKTLKGKGYTPAQNNPEAFHSTGKFDIETGEKNDSGDSFSSVFGKTVCRLAGQDDGVCAVTAAMESGTGLSDFAGLFPDRFYDVGIAEEHALTFSAGLAKAGMKPVLVLYSTFAQRVYDQLFHDVALQNIPLVFCLDRAGLVDGDGITHQGIFDVSQFKGIPGVNIYSPETYAELENALEGSFSGGINIIRYPKGGMCEYDRSSYVCKEDMTVRGSDTDADIAVITYGRICAVVDRAADLSGEKVKVIKLLKVHPLNKKALLSELEGCKKILVVEEGIKSGGVGESVAALISSCDDPKKVKIHAIDTFARHGTLAELYEEFGFTEEYISREISAFAKETE